MTLLSTAHPTIRDIRRKPRAHLIPLSAALIVTAAGIALVTYLLWPTWATNPTSEPGRLPVNVGGTLFNVPTAAVRMKIQRHSGPQERIDLNFRYPSLAPPDAPRHVSADTVEDKVQPIDRIFLAIAAHHDALAPDIRVSTIYPRYLDRSTATVEDGLTLRAFRGGTPYEGEDLFSASDPDFNARCTRDAPTPGMCVSERRVDGADLTFRFPRSWLAQWKHVAQAMDRLTTQLSGPKGQ